MDPPRVESALRWQHPPPHIHMPTDAEPHDPSPGQDTAREPDAQSDRLPTPSDSWLTETVADPCDVMPRRDGPCDVTDMDGRPSSEPHADVPETPGPAIERDRTLLLALTRMRLLSLTQIHARLFAGLDRAVASRTAKRLQRQGWISVWEDPIARGGRPRYFLPTTKGLQWALSELQGHVIGSAAERIVALMAPNPKRRPLVLVPGERPAFLAHQREINHLLTAYEGHERMRILWASSWDRPFPSSVRGIAMPQPDYVLVAQVDGQARLVFGEHDRGQESLAHFTSAKVERYSELADLPGFTESVLGFRSFSLWVTVTDTKTRQPGRRLAVLMEAARRGGLGSVARFSLSGWVHGYGESPVWLPASTAPASDSHSISGHRAAGTHLVGAWEKMSPPDDGQVGGASGSPGDLIGP